MISGVQIDFSPVRKKLLQINTFSKTELLPAAGEIAVQDIKAATASGINPSREGAPLPYSAPYKTYKQRTTGTDTVNWRLTNDMMNSLDAFQINETTIEINVSAEQYPKATWVSTLRPFIVSSQVQINKIVTDWKRRLLSIV